MTKKQNTVLIILLSIALVFGIYIARQPLISFGVRTTSMIFAFVEATAFHVLGGFDLTPRVLERYVELQRRTNDQSGQDQIKGRAGATEAEGRANFVRNCSAVGFPTVEECGRTLGYIGVLMVGIDRETGRHVDPIVLKERMIAKIEANAKLPPAKKEELLARERDALQNLRKFFSWSRVPQAHLKLMDEYRGRIFEAMRQQG
jgi:hypothetical protein